MHGNLTFDHSISPFIFTLNQQLQRHKAAIGIKVNSQSVGQLQARVIGDTSYFSFRFARK